MKANAASVYAPTPVPTRQDLLPSELHTLDSFLSVQPEFPSLTGQMALIHELACAYETSLRLQNVLRPLVPKTTWHQATDAAWHRNEGWPVEELTATIMFTDIVGFTALLEAHPVREVLTSLNDYFALLSQIVQRCRGDVHKFLGDGQMSLFVCPADAVKAGREIQLAVARFNARQQGRGLWQFGTRLAMDTGKVILAGVGSPERQDYTLIGRPVNRAAHWSKTATPGAVWISPSTYARVMNKDGFVPRTAAAVQSEEKPLIVYEMTCLIER